MRGCRYFDDEDNFASDGHRNPSFTDADRDTTPHTADSYVRSQSGRYHPGNADHFCHVHAYSSRYGTAGDTSDGSPNLGPAKLDLPRLHKRPDVPGQPRAQLLGRLGGRHNGLQRRVRLW